MHVAYISFDEVNRYFAKGLAPVGTTVAPLAALGHSVRQFDGHAYDLDCWPESVRQQLIQKFSTSPAGGPVALHSYSLEEGQVAALCANGVRVFRQLTSALFDELLDDWRLLSGAQNLDRPTHRLGTLATQSTVVRKVDLRTGTNRGRGEAAGRFAESVRKLTTS